MRGDSGGRKIIDGNGIRCDPRVEAHAANYLAGKGCSGDRCRLERAIRREKQRVCERRKTTTPDGSSCT